MKTASNSQKPVHLNIMGKDPFPWVSPHPKNHISLWNAFLFCG